MLSANVSNKVRKAVYARDHYRCALCDSPRAIQIHHVIKRSQGGTNDPQNLITLCMYCHGVIHGTRWPDMPDWMDQQELSQAAVEYVADYYAGSWHPWEKGGDTPLGYRIVERLLKINKKLVKIDSVMTRTDVRI